MSKKNHPNLFTKYENVDPDFQSESTSSQSLPQRSRHPRLVRQDVNYEEGSPEPTLCENLDTDNKKTRKEEYRDESNPFFSISISDDESELMPPNLIQTKSRTSPKIKNNSVVYHETTQSNIHNSEFLIQSSESHANTHSIIQIIGEHSKSSQQFRVTNSSTSDNQKMSEQQQLINDIVKALLLAQSTTKSTTPKVDIPKLSMSNYVDWSKKMKYALLLHQLWINPTLKPADLNATDKMKNEKAVLFMACYLDEKNAPLINESNDKCFISAWEAIEKFHQPKTATVLADIYGKLMDIIHKPGEPIEAHLIRLEEQFARFHTINEKVDSKHLVAIILASIRNSKDFASVFHSAMWEDKSTMTITKVKSMLVSIQSRLISDGEEQAHASNFHRPQSGTKRTNSPGKNEQDYVFELHTNQSDEMSLSGKIPIMSRPRHVNSNYFNSQTESSATCKSSTALSVAKMNYFNKNYYYANNCSSTVNKINLNSTHFIDFIVDSGATIHMCNYRNLFTNFRTDSGNRKVIIANGSTIPINGFGKVTFQLEDKLNNTIHTIVLSDVAYVPDLSVNLISVKALTALGLSVEFTKDHCFIHDSGMKIHLATIHNNSYTLSMTCPNNESHLINSLSCIHDLHRKFGHRNIAHIRQIAQTLDLKFTKCKCNPECEACLKGKLHALPFPQVSEKPSHPRDVIVTDVCGAIRTQSLGGSKYFVTFTCASTDYTEVVALKLKSDCKSELMKFIIKCKTQFGNFPKIIRSDRGGEYMDDELQSFLETNGIIPQFTVARCPEQNGIAERKNRTLFEAVRTMLFARNLPKFLWAEALQHANNTFNSIPKISEQDSPKEKYFGRKMPHQFIEFGTPVFITTTPINRSKLDERGEPGIFVGNDLNSKGYRIYSNGKIIIARHVKFLHQKINTQTSSDSLQSSKENNVVEDDNQSIKMHAPQEPRRSERIRLKQAQARSTATVFEPKTYNQAITCPDKEKWIIAMEEELQSIEDNQTWSAVSLPKDRKAIGCKWVYKIKNGDGGEAVRYKARLVAMGFTQKFGEDYDEVFAPVTRSSTFRILLSIASAKNFIVQQYDVKTAFLNGTLNEEIYLKPPANYKTANVVLKLHKSLYGLKQAARVWNQTLHKAMIRAGFIQSKFDECLYKLKEGPNSCYSIVHVDDMIFTSNSHSLIVEKTKQLSKSFELKCLGNIQNYLGIQVFRDINGTFSIDQSHYITTIASEFNLENCKSAKFPLDPGYHKLEDKNFLENNTKYRKLIGMLLYVSTNSRPDISAAVGILAQRVAKPRELDLTEALRIVRYLMSTKELKLILFKSTDTSSLQAFADSDWAEDRETRKSISGVICKMFGAPISWSSRKQNIVSTSTTESEFYALSEAVKEIQFLKNVIEDFDINVPAPITIFSDNQSTIKMIENSKFSSRTKHIDVRLHFIRDCAYNRQIKIIYCPSEDNVADLLTKPLAGVKIKYLRELAALH